MKKNSILNIFEQGRLADSESLHVYGGAAGNTCPSNYSQQCAPRYAVLCAWFTSCNTRPDGTPGFQLCYTDTYTLCGDYTIKN